MPIHIANPQVVAKIERLARVTGLGKTATVELAVDRMLAEASPEPRPWAGMERLLEQMDRLPERPDAFDPFEWDEHGLPR
jgi:antitoxin VapB